MEKSDTVYPVPMDVAVALVLLTRLPCPPLPARAFRRQAQATWAFPLVGAIVGLGAALVGLGALWLGLPATLAAGLGLGVQILLTGAMHEDGLADTADGLWGGWTRERRLEIMKDSVIGTYGVLALILSIGLRWSALTVLLPLGIGPVVMAGMVSRAVLPAVMTALPHARPDGLSHRVGAPPRWAAALAGALGVAAAISLTGWASVLPALSAIVAVTCVAALARARIGGQTGDILGAAQQVAEIAILIAFCAVMAF